MRLKIEVFTSTPSLSQKKGLLIKKKNGITSVENPTNSRCENGFIEEDGDCLPLSEQLGGEQLVTDVFGGRKSESLDVSALDQFEFLAVAFPGNL